MKTFTYTVKDPLGLHARPAGLLVKQASPFSSSIIITFNDKKADGKRLFSLMSLGVKGGDTLTVAAQGEDEAAAAAALQSFFESTL